MDRSSLWRRWEAMFDSESRPELRLKMNLANKLGLQPRQVAIWFQNKRARSKSKHMDECAMIKTKFDGLSSRYDIMKKGNQTQDPMKIATSAKPEILLAHNNELVMPPCYDAGKIVDYKEDTDFLNMAEVAQDSITSPDNGCNFDSCTFLDNPGYSAQWWDF